ncbi:hypothetical protein [Saccharothrix obliqua]|uniref:hypothetical protein n=1 Tax=Saccharothrix obliqua TaxID=2861747 RepID=UPI001C5F106B|nr:hypothetical protein [Saccharothrix obliqua]MBW4721893.1 hypothetical protein [Saccharothrix obliqua]
MIGRALVPLAVAISGLACAIAPAQAEPVGCTTSIEWVHEGSNHYYGRGNVRCDTGRYKVKVVCSDLQAGTGYVVYGTQVVNAPATATTTCHSGNVARSVHAVEDPPPSGVTGCVSWAEWVAEGISHYYGRGKAQCDTGRYTVKIVCMNLQTGGTYVVHGTEVQAPDVAAATCYSGNIADTVEAVPR